MFSQTFNIGGYTPAYAAEQKGKRDGQLSVEDGANFTWNLRGVQSGYGIQREFPNPPAPMNHPGIMWFDNAKWLFMDDGIYQLQSGAWPLRYAYNRSQATVSGYDLETYPWSYAYVGTKHFFSHPTLSDIIVYDEHVGAFSQFRDASWNGPIFGITHADNALIVQLQDVDTWSIFDEGEQFDYETWECASGAQSHALIRDGQPYGVWPYRDGYLTFTSEGIMLSTPFRGQNVHPDGGRVMTGGIRFNHEEVTYDDLPLGPCAICHIDEKQVIWLASTGFNAFQAAQGGGFGGVQPYAQEMGRFYHETLIPKRLLDTADIDHWRLVYQRDLRCLFVSEKLTGDVVYSHAHVYEIELEKWGVWVADHLEVGFGRHDSEIGNQNFRIRDLGALDLAGFKRISHKTPSENSWIKLSPMRLQAPDEDVLAQMMSSVQGLRIGTAGPAHETTKKGALTSPFKDVEVEYHTPSYFFAMISSGDDDLTTLQDEQTYAQLVNRSHHVSNYSCHSTGVDHTVIITALLPDQHFDIRHIELSYFWAGLK